MKRLKLFPCGMSLLAAMNVAAAMEIETGNPELQIMWTNTLRYNLGQRISSPDPAIANWPIAQASDALFGKKDIVTNRLDLLTELTLRYKEDYGFRVSAAGWYDHAYRDGRYRNNPLFDGSAVGPTANGEFSREVDRFYHGPSGELLDAFAFAKFTLADKPLYVRAGRHTVVYGESMFTAMNGIAYSQMPIDARKGVANPGTQVKELYLPLAQLSASYLATPEVTLGAQYFFEWKPSRFPEGGTYFGSYDGAFRSGERFPVAPNFAFNVGNEIQPKNRGNFGLSAHWRPESLDGGVIGAYYRRFDDKIPALTLDGSTTHVFHGKDIDLVGISYGGNFFGWNTGAELSYRKNSVLTTVGFSPDMARGNTAHFVLNGLKILKGGSLFDTAVVIAEVSGSHLVEVTKNASLYNDENNVVGCPSRSATIDGCATRNFVAFDLTVEPSWSAVLPGIDLSLPLAYSKNLYGVSSNNFGGNKGAGSAKIGIRGDFYQKYKLTLAYTNYFGSPSLTDAGLIRSGNGALGKDRDWLSLTFQTAL